MANIKSAKKRVLVIKKKTLENKIAMTKLKNTVKKFNAAVESGDKEAAKAAYLVAVKRMDQAAAHGLIHKNKAAHKKSQFTKALNAMA
ncbi:MAG: 30S ribosomal protein S20 [Clostridia bacterium]|nr:30S ribosomal protein S20 [Clostridia bacterium]